MLQGVGKEYDYSVIIMDLNIEFIHFTGYLPRTDPSMSLFMGDHSKPGNILDVVEKDFLRLISRSSGLHDTIDRDSLRELRLNHKDVLRIVTNLMGSHLGEFLASRISTLDSPPLIGISLMWSGQVIPGLFIAMVAKRLFPETRIVMGGPHVTSISDRIPREKEYGRLVDGYIPYQNETSFLELLQSMERGDFQATGMIIAGEGHHEEIFIEEHIDAQPVFSNLQWYGRPRLILPYEISRGCLYGKCAFCTYPSMEGKYHDKKLSLLEEILPFVERNNAALSFKDCLMAANRLEQVSEVINGRVEWSASTKLSSNLTSDIVRLVMESGCRTLEVGLETLDPESQRYINKVQDPKEFERFIRSCQQNELPVVVNYITGFPHEDPVESMERMTGLKKHLESYEGLMFRIEHNRFQLLRMSRIARESEEYGIRVVRSWPWSSVLGWRIT